MDRLAAGRANAQSALGVVFGRLAGLGVGLSLMFGDPGIEAPPILIGEFASRHFRCRLRDGGHAPAIGTLAGFGRIGRADFEPPSANAGEANKAAVCVFTAIQANSGSAVGAADVFAGFRDRQLGAATALRGGGEDSAFHRISLLDPHAEATEDRFLGMAN